MIFIWNLYMQNKVQFLYHIWVKPTLGKIQIQIRKQISRGCIISPVKVDFTQIWYKKLSLAAFKYLINHALVGVAERIIVHPIQAPNELWLYLQISFCLDFQKLKTTVDQIR